MKKIDAKVSAAADKADDNYNSDNCAVWKQIN